MLPKDHFPMECPSDTGSELSTIPREVCMRCAEAQAWKATVARWSKENRVHRICSSQSTLRDGSACPGYEVTSPIRPIGSPPKAPRKSLKNTSRRMKPASTDHGKEETSQSSDLDAVATLLNFNELSIEETPMKKSRKNTLRHSLGTVEVLQSTVSSTLKDELGLWRSTFCGVNQEREKLARSMKEQIETNNKYILSLKTTMEALFGGMDTSENTLSSSTIFTDGSHFPISSDSSTDTQCLSDQQVDTFISALESYTSPRTGVPMTGIPTLTKIKEEPSTEESPAADISHDPGKASNVPSVVDPGNPSNLPWYLDERND